jgi:uncharacterized protein (DUF924 family)
MAVTAEEILDYWFGEAAHDAAKAGERMAFWFRSTPEQDAAIAQRFSATLQAAADGSLAHWETDALSALALVIVLDQFPRNIHRGTPAAFAHDEEALNVARAGIRAGYMLGLTTAEQGFFAMPLQHSEDLTCQRDSVALFERIAHEAAPAWRQIAHDMLRYARLHLDLVQRFGRFPHRNAILGRTSTPAELEFLASEHESFGQRATKT